MEWAHSGLCGTQAHIGPSQVLGWCPVSLYFYLFLFSYFFSSSNWTPLKNSGSNPMSFLFLVGVPWCTNEIRTPLRKSWLRHCPQSPQRALCQRTDPQSSQRAPCQRALLLTGGRPCPSPLRHYGGRWDRDPWLRRDSRLSFLPLGAEPLLALLGIELLAPCVGRAVNLRVLTGPSMGDATLHRRILGSVEPAH